MPEPIGGWNIRTVSQFEGVARGIHAWRTLEGAPVFAFGTSTKLYASIGGGIRDITPPLHYTVLNDCFTTVNGSDVVTVYLEFHRLSEGDEVVFTNHQSTVGGLTIEGTYTVTSVLTSGRFTITHTSNATSDETTPTGGYVDFEAALPVGLEDAPLFGYGTGSYGAGSFGTAGNSSDEVRTWSLDNWGEFLLANPTSYGIFEWQPEVSYPDLAFDGTAITSSGWAFGTGWAAGGVATAGTSSNLSQDITEVLEGGRTYRVDFTVALTAGTVKFRVNAGTSPAVIDVGEASSEISKAGTYSRTFLCPADAQDIVFEKDSAFAGSVTNISYTLESKAQRITTAPPRVDGMFVDPRGVVVALGTTKITGDYSPTVARNSGLGNNREWIPDTDTIASEYVLRGGGGRLMAGLATSEQSLAWADNGVFSFQYQGQIGEAYNINLLGTKCGLISRASFTEQNGFVAWMSNTRNFYVFRGISTSSLGKPEAVQCPIAEDIFDNLDYNQALKCHAGINPEFMEAWFFYPDARDGNECSRVAALNWPTGLWMPHILERTTWESSGVFEDPIALSANGYIYNHETGNTANGGLLGSWIETGYFDSGEGEQLIPFKSIVPDVKDQVGDLGFTITRRMEANASEIVSRQYVATPTTERVNFRLKGRQFKIKLDWLTTGGWGRLGSFRYIFDGGNALK